MSKNIVVVTGATGVQGGSVARFLLKDGTFAVRAITRNPDSPAARELAAQGATVVFADLKDPATLHKALTGAYGVFGVTNFLEPGVGGDGERAQGKALVDAAKLAGVKHFIWSTLDRSEFKAAQWESKADVDDHLQASGVPRTSLYTSYYYENYIKFSSIVKRPDGQFEYFMPVLDNVPFATYCAGDTGAWVLYALKHPGEWIGRDMRIATEFLSYRDMMKTIYDVTGKQIHLNAISPEEYKGVRNNPIPETFYDTMLVMYKYNSPPFRDPKLSRDLFPGLRNFKDWVEENSAVIAV